MVWEASNLTKRKHYFFDAKGGISKGLYKGLNVNTSSDDDAENLNENLNRIAQYFGLNRKNLLLLKQGVSDKAVYVEEASQDKIEADGDVTDKVDIVLSIRTADCAPILLEDRKNGVVGAAHAGWRGAYKGIIGNVVRLMIEKGAELDNIAAAIGPCIGKKSYEVDESFYCQFVNKDSLFVKYFINSIKKGFYLFDLEQFCADRLRDAGISNIEISGHDTYTLEDEYFSFRRFTHQGIIQKPRCFATELSGIVL